MAKKRKLPVVVQEEREERPPEPGWRDWAKGTYAKYWFVLACFFLDMVVFFELQRSADLGWAVSFLALVLLVGLQTLLYLRIWPWHRGADEEMLEEEDFL
jgi:hypothetical protein